MDVRELVLKYALKNAVDHGGKANVGAVMGKVIAEDPSLRKRAKEILVIVKEVVEKVNSMSLDEQKRLMEKYTYELKKKEKRDLPPLPGAEKGVVMRFAPEPGGFIHIGNLRAALVNWFYVRKYGGKYILRFDDTNPRNVKLVYYDAIIDDLEAIGIKPHEVVYQSDRLKIYENQLIRLIEEGHAYASFEKNTREKRIKSIPFEGRNRSAEESLEILDKIKEGEFREGEVAFFLRTDMKHPNPALRDPVLARIIDFPHPRGIEARLYPTYNFASAVDDVLLNITHILRGKDHENNGKVQAEIQKRLGYEPPWSSTFGRLKIKGADLSKRKIRQALREGKVSGWDDPSLLTVRALLRRGIRPEAVRRLFKELGPKATDITLDLETLYTINRQLIDPSARRVYFVENPIKLIVEDAPSIVAKIPWHPDADMGQRIYNFEEGEHLLFVDRRDFEDKVRLKHLYNVEVVERTEDEIVAKFAGFDIGKERKIQWVTDNNIIGEVVFPNGTRVEGLLEWWANTLEPGEVVQLERLYFVKVEANWGERIKMVYTHR